MASKQHYLLLDGLRGVAALAVLGYHLFEAIAFAAGAPEQQFFHGFLAVDFFLILSGFVMGYAYDSRWGEMSIGNFCGRRLIRLHPMVVMGVLIGVVTFCCQGRLAWDGSQASWGAVLLSTLMALLMLPNPSSLDVRGNTESFPLNGPHWSLFFEYIGSILYALVLHKLSTKALKIWVGLAALTMLAVGVFGPDGSIAYGWSSQPFNMFGGACRMLFAYPAGLLMARLYHERERKPLGAWTFPLCAAALLLLLAVPSLGAAKVYFEIFCVAICFPAIIWFGARGTVKSKGGNRVVSLLGEISYPLYAIHYPFIYLYIGWINSGAHPFGPQPWATPVVISIICIVLAVLLSRFYDRPVRKWLSSRLIK